MSAPRLEIDLYKIEHNAHLLVEKLAAKGIAVTGITKATLGSPEISGALLRAGVHALGDSRIENLEAMRRAHISVAMILIRSPMLSQTARVVAHADVSFNTELDVVNSLSCAAGRIGKTHGIVLMVELGDLREGILPGDLEFTVREALRFPNVALVGIGANLACHNGVVPGVENMAELSELATSIEATFGIDLGVVSGGNSANLPWALSGADKGRVNELRLGESYLLGREPLGRQPISGLHTDAITLVVEVIESKMKPSQPWGAIAQNAFGVRPPTVDRGDIAHTILAIGRQDTDPEGLLPPFGTEILGASSDHLITDSGPRLLSIGSEVRFQLNYSALVRAMTSPFVVKHIKVRSSASPA